MKNFAYSLGILAMLGLAGCQTGSRHSHVPGLVVVSLTSGFTNASAIVRAVRGSAHFSRSHGPNDVLHVGSQVQPGDTLYTDKDSAVDLFLGVNGPVIRVTESTTLSINELSRKISPPETNAVTRLTLHKGRILGNVKSMSAASSYEIIAPAARIRAVQGNYDFSTPGTISVTSGKFQYYAGSNPVITVVDGQSVSPPRFFN